MLIEPSYIEAEVYVHDKSKNRFFLKITFVEMGMWINSFTVQPSKYEGHDWWVQPPKHRQSKGWTETVDFDKSYQLWNIIQKKSIQAVKDYLGEEARLSKDDTFELDDNEPLNLDEVPF